MTLEVSFDRDPRSFWSATLKNDELKKDIEPLLKKMKEALLPDEKTVNEFEQALKEAKAKKLTYPKNKDGKQPEEEHDKKTLANLTEGVNYLKTIRPLITSEFFDYSICISVDRADYIVNYDQPSGDKLKDAQGWVAGSERKP